MKRIERLNLDRINKEQTEKQAALSLSDKILKAGREVYVEMFTDQLTEIEVEIYRGSWWWRWTDKYKVITDTLREPHNVKLQKWEAIYDRYDNTYHYHDWRPIEFTSEETLRVLNYLLENI